MPTLTERIDSYIEAVNMLGRLGEALVNFQGSALGNFYERGIFRTDFQFEGQPVKLRARAKAWLRNSAIDLERTGLDLVAELFNDVLGSMHVSAPRPEALSTPRLGRDSAKMEIATRLTDLVEALQVLRPMHEAAVAVRAAAPDAR